MKTNLSTSPLSVQEWDVLEAKAKALETAVQEMMVAVLLSAGRSDEGISPFFMNEADKLRDFNALPSYFYHCQPEWTGGDSLDPKNHILREPHITNRRFTVLSKVES